MDSDTGWRAQLSSSPARVRQIFTARWRFTLSCLVMLSLVFAFVLTINDFLAITRHVDANILLVEGWISYSSSLSEAAEEFNRGHYERLVTVGESFGRHDETLDAENSADVAATLLRELGVDRDRIVVLRIPGLTVHRTFASALTLKNWLAKSNTRVTGVNVFTLGAHARKSLLVFERVLGPGIRVGVIAGTDSSVSAQ